VLNEHFFMINALKVENILEELSGKTGETKLVALFQMIENQVIDADEFVVIMKRMGFSLD
jgi:hypothetical protein